MTNGRRVGKEMAVLVAIALAGWGSGCGQAPPASDPRAAVADDATTVVARAREIHDRVLTIDTHDDIPLNFATPEVDPGIDGDRQVDLPKMEAGGLDAGFFVVYVGQTERTVENYARARADAMTKFEAIHRMAEELYPERIELALRADDFPRIAGAGKRVAAIGIENGYVIGHDLSLLSSYYDLGARYFGLVHNGHNDIADSANPRPGLGDVDAEHDGVSAFGETVIAELNRLGMMVDVSHASKATMLDAVRLSRAPIIASHSSARALTETPRNLDDEQLRALRENGGVVQIVALDAFVSRTAADGEQAAAAPSADVAAFVDHIDHAVQLIGIDHVGISSDFDGGGGVDGWRHAGETFNVTLELVRRGYTEEEIAKLWGGNLLRVLRAVEQVAADGTSRGR